MLITELFEAIKLRGFSSDNRAITFIEEFEKMSTPNPLNDRERILHDTGVTLVVNSFKNNSVHLSDIRSIVKGNGSKCLQEICMLADKHRVTIDLFAKGYGDTPTSVLKSWYEKFGFEQHETYSDGYEMIRKPFD